jgi:hypothetical protein
MDRLEEGKGDRNQPKSDSHKYAVIKNTKQIDLDHDLESNLSISCWIVATISTARISCEYYIKSSS